MKLVLVFFSFLSAIATVAIHACMDITTYRNIDDDVKEIADSIGYENELVHFYGGIVRLVAHDFMDYDSSSTPFGSDGCIDFNHEVNKGLDTIWCDGCNLKKLYDDSYSGLSRADFWIAAANAVIRQLSVNQSFDMISKFYWGRKDVSTCRGSGNRLPTGTSCREIEDTFLVAMGLNWRDAVALLGAHTIGRGHQEFSGHEGMWMPSSAQALVFDKQYYKELKTRSWRPRNPGTDEEDFQTGSEDTLDDSQMMLLTDMCLVYDTDYAYPCCGNGSCDFVGCPRYSKRNPRKQAVEAVNSYLNDVGQSKFYKGFSQAWFKATTNGHENLKSLRSQC